MTRSGKIPATLAAFLIATSLTSATATDGQEYEAYRLVAGQPHPDFALPSIVDGTMVKLSDYRGRKMLLLHFASW